MQVAVENQPEWPLTLPGFRAQMIQGLGEEQLLDTNLPFSKSSFAVRQIVMPRSNETIVETHGAHLIQSLYRKTLGHHPTHRQADKDAIANVQGIQKAFCIPNKRAHGIGAVRDARGAVPPSVIGHQSQALGHQGQDRLPYLLAGSKGMGKDPRRTAALIGIVQLDVPKIANRHQSTRICAMIWPWSEASLL